MVATGQLCPFDLTIVKVCAVGTLEITNHEGVADVADFSVAARYLVVLELNRISSIASDAHGSLMSGKIVARAFVSALNDKQRRHAAFS